MLLGILNTFGGGALKTSPSCYGHYALYYIHHRPILQMDVVPKFSENGQSKVKWAVN